MDIDATYIQWGGRKRKCFPKECQYCGNTFYVPKHVYEKYKCCSKQCSSNLIKSRRVSVTCSNCGTKILKQPSDLVNSKTGNYFCNRKCKEKYQSENGKDFTGVFSPAVAQAKHKRQIVECEKCGYNEYPEILVIHHKDGDRSNNNSDNWIVLCQNCHAIEHLVPTESGLKLWYGNKNHLGDW